MTMRLIFSFLVLSLASIASAQVNEIPDSSAVTGVGKTFEIKNSDFLNVSIESSNEVFAYVQSLSQQITINVAKPNPDILSTTLTIKNLTPETNYNLTKNGITEVIVSDNNGIYVCEVDLSLPQKILITAQQ